MSLAPLNCPKIPLCITHLVVFRGPSAVPSSLEKSGRCPSSSLNSCRTPEYWGSTTPRPRQALEFSFNSTFMTCGHWTVEEQCHTVSALFFPFPIYNGSPSFRIVAYFIASASFPCNILIFERLSRVVTQPSLLYSLLQHLTLRSLLSYFCSPSPPSSLLSFALCPLASLGSSYRFASLLKHMF